MPTPGSLMATEIAEQPDVLARLLREGRSAATQARAAIAAYRPRFAIFAARGTSDHAALYGKYLAEVQLDLRAGLASPSSVTVYGSRPDMHGVLFVAVSQSGESPDLVESLQVARHCGALTVAITNNADSPLAQMAVQHVDILAGPERAVAATKTYTAQLLALHLLLGSDDVTAVPEAAARTLENAAAAYAAAERFRFGDRLVATRPGLF